MWVIENIKAEVVKFYLLVGEDYVVGRKDCPILIAGDQSISRKHATLALKHPECNLNRPNAPSVLMLKESSKFGTLLNGDKLASGSETCMKDGDCIIFGAFKSNEWRVKYEPLVVAASALLPPEKKALKGTIHHLGGHMVSEWCQECTHLIMTELKVTVKVIAALVACRPIVTPDFWKQTVDAIKQHSALPKPANCLPPIAETAINKDEISFAPNASRRKIFHGKTFYFVTQKQFKRLQTTVQMAGGRSVLLDEDSALTTLRPQLTAIDSCMLYTEHQDGTQPMSQIGQEVVSEALALLRKHKLRPIPESELGLAVLYVSTAMHCNPTVAEAGLNLLSAVPSETLLTQDVLVYDTQTSSQQASRNRNRLSRRGQNAKVTEAASTSNQPPLMARQNVTSTPKISKIEETVLEVSTRSNPSASSLPTDTSPEFSFHGKLDNTAHLGQKIKVESVSDNVTDARNNEAVEKSIAEKSETSSSGRETNRVRVKEEILSQGSGDRIDENNQTSNNNSQPKSKEMVDSLRVKAESVDVSKLSNSRSGSTVKQGSLDKYRKVKAESLTVIGEEMGGDRGARELRDETARVKEEQVDEEPMDEEPDVATMRMEGVTAEGEGAAESTEMSRGHIDGRKTDTGSRSGKRKTDWSNDDADGNGGGRANPDVGVKKENSMWKKKARIDIFSQEEEDETNSNAMEEDPQSTSNVNDAIVDLPRGFVSARVPIEDQISVKVDVDYLKEENLPSQLIVVEKAALIVRKQHNPHRNAVQEIGSGKPVKNFKKFRKAGYAGQTSIPTIIGGRDLFTHKNNPSKDIEEMFMEEVRAENRRDKQEEIADKLFAFEPRRAPTTKKKR